MTSTEDDALSWAGDEDRLTSGASGKPKAQRGGASNAQAPEDSVPPEQPKISSVALIGYGILAGVYLLFTVAWLIAALRNPKELSDVFSNFMFQAGIWVCVFAPALWFATVLYVLREKSVAKHFLWLVLGAIVLIPWPYVTWAG